MPLFAPTLKTTRLHHIETNVRAIYFETEASWTHQNSNLSDSAAPASLCSDKEPWIPTLVDPTFVQTMSKEENLPHGTSPSWFYMTNKSTQRNCGMTSEESVDLASAWWLKTLASVASSWLSAERVGSVWQFGLRQSH